MISCSTTSSQRNTSQIAILNLNEALSRKADKWTDRSEHSNSSSASSVTFSASVEMVKLTLHRTEYTEAERNATWYNPLELQSIQNERRRLIHSLQIGQTVECSRGLESKTKQGKRERQMAIMDAISAVLDEQEEQMIRCAVDPEALARIYGIFSRESQTLAIEQAAQDQEEVFSCSNADDPLE